MEEFVQMSLKTYDSLKSNVEYLKGALKKEQESHSEDVAQAQKEINDLAEKIDQYKQHILKSNCKLLNVEVYSLEQYLNIDSWTYGMNYKDEILENCIYNLAVVKGRPKLCYKTNCNDCDFKINQIGCRNKVKDWLKQTHEKPVYKLTKFEKELLECYSDVYSFKVFNSLNGMKEKGYFKGIDDNELIGDILAKCEVVG